MRQRLAEKLLLKIMQWDVDEVQVERPMLQAISNFKYDEYRQFSPGMLFLGSLTSWLRQFETLEERRIAYSFVKSQLVFISENQVQQLVSLAFSDAVQPFLLTKTGNELEIDPYKINEIYHSATYKNNKRKTLFIGLSDGSRIDFFRRISGLNNEQVFSTYYISEEKSADLQKELKKDGHEKFNSIFLIDDFTASGKSYFRQEDRKYKGKIFKFIDFLLHPEDYKDISLQELIDLDSLEINVLFYIATEDAKDYLEMSIAKWKKETGSSIIINIKVIQIIPNSIKISKAQNKEFFDLMIKYFDESIIDVHYEKGKHDEPYLGFNECSLPLVLNHNTPNNSLPILWFPDDKKYRGLFPRITRHF
ncbi:hypothetical protein [Maribacter sp. 2308TA10-17]|uniref:phosphoribosyltransferase-like protein n=1 Tax=Maribacter sp. 2308TA10-17 TaxID=3386276 RepID=UPI0039BCDC76